MSFNFPSPVAQALGRMRFFLSALLLAAIFSAPSFAQTDGYLYSFVPSDPTA